MLHFLQRKQGRKVVGRVDSFDLLQKQNHYSTVSLGRCQTCPSATAEICKSDFLTFQSREPPASGWRFWPSCRPTRSGCLADPVRSPLLTANVQLKYTSIGRQADHSRRVRVGPLCPECLANERDFPVQVRGESREAASRCHDEVS